MKVLFVCLGNICRSSTAEAIFKKKFAERNIAATFDSAGTAPYHVGQPSDSRTISHGQKRGYTIDHIARQVEPMDFEKFDYILAMDQSNIEKLTELCLSKERQKKFKLITEYCTKMNYKEVPDPYYGTAADFDLVIHILEDCAEGFIAKHYRPA